MITSIVSLPGRSSLYLNLFAKLLWKKSLNNWNSYFIDIRIGDIKISTSTKWSSKKRYRTWWCSLFDIVILIWSFLGYIYHRIRRYWSMIFLKISHFILIFKKHYHCPFYSRILFICVAIVKWYLSLFDSIKIGS